MVKLPKPVWPLGLNPADATVNETIQAAKIM